MIIDGVFIAASLRDWDLHGSAMAVPGKNVESLLAAYEVLTEDPEEVTVAVAGVDDEGC